METITTRSLIQVVILTLCLTIKQRSQHCSQSSASVDTNPVGASFVATLPVGAGVQGSLSGTTNDGGHGTAWEASLTNLPSAGGPFLWYIHFSPVPANGDCAGTSGHLDPFSVGDATVCDPNSPANCQIGDLSSKFSKITASLFSLSFDNLFFSTDLTYAAFVGSRSLTIHTADKKRIACADFVAETSDREGDSGDGEDDSGDEEDTGNNEDAGPEKRVPPLPPGVVPSPTAISTHGSIYTVVLITNLAAAAAPSEGNRDDEDDTGDDWDDPRDGDDGDCPADEDE